MGKILYKKFQTIESSGEIGSVLYFEFDGPADKTLGFIRGLMWGGDKPSVAHPEEILAKGNVLIILSFPYKGDLSKKMIEYFK
ncbi:MAG: hypothetical protein ACO3EE_07830 [Flavobacteriales bacterium]